MKNKKSVICNEVYEERKEARSWRIRKLIVGGCFFVMLFVAFIFSDINMELPKEIRHEKLVVAASNVTPIPNATPVPTPIGTKVNVTINYKTNKINVQAGSGGSKRFYISTDKQKNWNLIYESVNGTSTSINIELDGYLKSSETVLYFKGNKDIAPVMVTIPKEPNDLDIDYKVINNKGTIVVNKTSALIEYRVNSASNWRDYTTINTELYEDTGITLEFRTKAAETIRAGKIVKVKIPKRPAAPSIKVDYKKMEITGLKYKAMQYRVGDGNWQLFEPQDSKAKSLSLYSLLLPGVTDTNSQPLKQTTIEFRALPTDKKVASAVKLIEITAQPSAPGGTVVLNNSTLTISDASKDKPYEYVVLQTTETIDITKAKWIKVTSNKAIVIKKTGNATTIQGDKVYVRLASYTDKQTKQVIPPSLYRVIPITKVTP